MSLAANNVKRSRLHRCVRDDFSLLYVVVSAAAVEAAAAARIAKQSKVKALRDPKSERKSERQVRPIAQRLWLSAAAAAAAARRLAKTNED